jgi:putative tricarboxylic transport membrane protein
MKINDAVVGALLAVLGVAILVHVQGYPTIPGQKYGPALFPGLIAAGMVICGVLLIRRGTRAGGPWLALAAWTRSPHRATNFLCVAGALVFYIAAADTLGFIVVGIVLLLVLFWKLGVRLRVAIPVAVIATLLVHLLFYKMMRVPLPWGVLSSVSW